MGATVTGWATRGMYGTRHSLWRTADEDGPVWISSCTTAGTTPPLYLLLLPNSWYNRQS